LSGASIVAHATLTDRSGAKSELAFTSRSKRLGPGLAESVVRFSAPPELAGAGFLQIQKKDGDDYRFRFLPDLKRSRRISGTLRSNAFMGTDLSFADLDRRDLREATVKLTGNETIEKWDCYVLDVVPKRQDSQYSHGVALDPEGQLHSASHEVLRSCKDAHEDVHRARSQTSIGPVVHLEIADDQLAAEPFDRARAGANLDDRSIQR